MRRRPSAGSPGIRPGDYFFLRDFPGNGTYVPNFQFANY
jgi:hypothetical protein